MPKKIHPNSLKNLVHYYWKGKHPSEETKKKISEAKKGKKPYEITNEIREHMRKKHLYSKIRKKRSCVICRKKEINLKEDRRESYDTKYKYWMIEVKKRDRWKCKISNGECNGKLNAHHILPWRDFPELRYEINNGITLCQTHHPKRRVEEKRLILFFQGLVSVSN